MTHDAIECCQTCHDAARICPQCFDVADLDELDAILEKANTPLPEVDEYGICTGCLRRRGTGCACGMTFAEKIKTIALDEEALRIFNMGGKGRKRGSQSADNKRNA